ncbi:MAG: FN3 associated domain-containing protein [Parafilimonas sp.]
MKLKNIFATALIPLNILLLFFLIFSDQLIIPTWLQVLGRMHPVILHFPIVLVLIYFVVVLLVPKKNISEHWYIELSEWILLAAAITAVFTALMGIFLSKETGYDADSITAHKYLGSIISLLLFIIYFSRNFLKQQQLLFKLSAACAAFIIIWAGHLGGDITHGENFVLAPVTPSHIKPQVGFNDAFIYADLVEPILESKCMGCHNNSKAKGELVMETKELLIKGGKNGKLWDTAKSDLGLLMRRIHLPLEEKEHMPPSGKPQLTDEEEAILYEWIREGSVFDKQVIDLPVIDTLRILASKVLKQSSEEVYDFAAADEKQINKLSNNNRVITPLAMQSPALVLNFYNKPFYSSKQLEELQPLATQIVELNLENMPVSDNDIKTIAQFKNLRRLNLNFTTITGSTLDQLKDLLFLKSLSLSGTPVKPSQLTALTSLPKLRAVYLWNTNVDSKDVPSLEEKNKNITYQTGFKGDSTILKLTPPILENEDFVITESTPLKLKHYIKGTVIRYTLDDKDPDSLSSPVYNKNIHINSDLNLKAKAFKPGWISSDIIEQHFFKGNYHVDSAILLSKVDDKFKADGAKTIIDGEKSDMNFASGKWIGYREKPMEVMLLFNKPIEASSIILSMLQQIGAYIFPPAQVEVWGGNNRNNLKLLSKINPEQPNEKSGQENLAVKCSFNKTSVSYIKLLVTPVKSLPVWHAGKGEKAWVFVDEIFVN